VTRNILGPNNEKNPGSSSIKAQDMTKAGTKAALTNDDQQNHEIFRPLVGGNELIFPLLFLLCHS